MAIGLPANGSRLGSPLQRMTASVLSASSGMQSARLKPGTGSPISQFQAGSAESTCLASRISAAILPFRLSALTWRLLP